jgi:hypothetical protein
MWNSPGYWQGAPAGLEWYMVDAGRQGAEGWRPPFQPDRAVVELAGAPPLSTPPEQPGEEAPIRLKDPELAALLAWLLPGLGHLYQGRRAKAALFFVCIMGTFLYGVYLGGSSELGWGRVVYFAWTPGHRRLPYLCQIGAGLPAMPALVQAHRAANDRQVWWNGFMAPPRPDDAKKGEPNWDQPTLHELHFQLAPFFELGTVYTMIGGLLNVLAIYDAWCGPVIPHPGKKEDEDEDRKPGEGQGEDEHG